MKRRTNREFYQIGYNDGYGDALVRAWIEVEKADLGFYTEKYLKTQLEKRMKEIGHALRSNHRNKKARKASKKN